MEEMTDMTRPSDAEVTEIVDRMASSYARTLAYYMRGPGGLSREDAEMQVACSPEKATQILSKPSQEIRWLDLDRLHRSGTPGAHLELWARIKRDAADSVAGGSLVHAALQDQAPWMKAVAIATRSRFRDEWQPRGGIEDSLIDILAQSLIKWQMWVEMEVRWGTLKDRYQWEDEKEPHHGPRLEYADAARHAAEMADRSHRQFMRTLRAMRDLRRYATNITINNDGQINIGGQQQVNNEGAEPADSNPL